MTFHLQYVGHIYLYILPYVFHEVISWMHMDLGEGGGNSKIGM